MGRAPCCEKDSVKRGPWTPEEDAKLLACIAQHGTGSWRTLPKKAGLQRCGKSCRLRWTNYLRPDLKHGRFSDQEERLIVSLHAALGSRWSLIAAQLPGRTDNDVKNYWNTRLKKKLCEMGIDPITHKPISQLLADLAGSIALPKGSEIAEATLGCFKDDMLNVLMRKRNDHSSSPGMSFAPLIPPQQSWEMLVNVPSSNGNEPDKFLEYDLSGRQRGGEIDRFAQKMKGDLSTPMQSRPMPLASLISAPCGPVSGVRSATGALARSMVSVQGQFSSCGFSPVSDQFVFNNDHISNSMLDMLLEPVGSPGDEKSVPDLNRLNDPSINRSRSPLAMTAPGFLQTFTVSNDDLQQMITQRSKEFTASDQYRIPTESISTTQQHLYMALLQQQEARENRPSKTLAMKGIKLGGVAATTAAATGDAGQSTRSETTAWSPSCSGSNSASSTSLIPATDQASPLDGVLSSDALLWDLSELGSMVS